MIEKIRLFLTSLIILSIFAYFILVGNTEMNMFEIVWRTIVCLYLFSILRKDYNETHKVSELQKQLIFIASLTLLTIMMIVYLETY
ncbi:hypothetical protein CD798_01085 [Bacillaceae bacterium SAOS 7]|nr:hypothetical protein CD798_01085 [Bacillaceae bacterium SAOS 7]